ncbi:MAG: DsbA family protein [Anaerolineales bacterium]|nr:DsbA family protein [Anaerolineales bacterium]
MSKRQELREKRRKKQKQQRVLIIIMVVAGALLIAAALIIPTLSLSPVGEVVQITPQAFSMPVNSNAIGNPDAPVKVDVWEDFQCPACARYSENVEKLIIQNYVETGKVYYTFHHFPFIDDKSATKESDQAANASMCAGEQGRFWDFKNMLFANWNGENQGAFSDKRLIAFADALGLKMSDFKTCFDENRYREQIDQDSADGAAIGVSGTPSIFVNGQQVTPGYIPSYEELSQVIEAALSGQ